MEGRRILRLDQRRADLRFPLPERFAERVANARIDRLARQAKFLAAHLSTGEVLVMHLGMTGRFTIGAPMQAQETGKFHHQPGNLSAHDHVVFHMEGGETVTYNDPRRFGFMELWPAASFEAYPRLKTMGPEPLSNAFSASYLDTALSGKTAPIKAALLDQSIIAGLGNIYVCEALYRAGISPKRLSRSVPGMRASRLAPAINAVIAEAIAAGGSSISDFAGTDGELGYFQHRFDVYDREGAACKHCGAAVKRIVQSGRSTFYCSGCQK